MGPKSTTRPGSIFDAKGGSKFNAIQHLAIEVPDGSLLEHANAVLDAAIKGAISPDQAASIISMGNELARLKEYEELEKRLIALEQKANKS